LHLGGREQMGWNLYLLARYASSLCSLAPLAGGWILRKKLFSKIRWPILYFHFRKGEKAWV
jgi:hypothetical protein